MAWKSNMTDAGELAEHLITLYKMEFLISGEYTLTRGLPSLASYIFEERAKTFTFPIYSKLTVQTSALTEDTEATPEAMVDTAVTVTPAEFGNVVVQTELVNVQSGGLPAVAAVRLAGVNMRESLDSRFLKIGEAGSNELTVAASEAATVAGNILTPSYYKQTHAKLSTSGIPGPYFAVIHPHVTYDIKNDTGTDSWTEVNVYQDRVQVVNNEIGIFAGFRNIEHPMVSINSDAGSGTVDTYHSQFFGMNAFGFGVSLQPGLRIIPPSDNLGRFTNIGWYGIYQSTLVDTNAHWLVTSSSSIGSN